MGQEILRAREFIAESRAVLAPEYAEPMRYTYTIPELKTGDPYSTYRFGVALALARAEQDPTAVFDQDWTTDNEKVFTLAAARRERRAQEGDI